MVDNAEPKESILGILRSAINIEKFGIRYYQALSSAIQDENGKALMNYLIDAESDHQRKLEQEYDKHKELGDEALKPLPLDNLADEGDISIFSEPLEDYDPSSVSAKDAIIFGMHVEERSIRFYSMAAKVINAPELLDTLNNLIEFEKGHLELLKKNLNRLETEDTWFGY
jgi:rubrerythrin